MTEINKLYCAAVTPMKGDYSIDYIGLESNIEWYIQNKLDGILLCGGTGEFVSLTAQERRDIVNFASNVIAERASIMVGCAAETTADAVTYARHAQDSGADALLLISSYYFKPSEEELYQHFKAVAKSVDLPIVLYNNPDSSGIDLSPQFVRRVSAIDNIKHLKESTGDLLRFRKIKEACADDFNVMVGCDALAYELIKNGASGWISITSNALAHQSQAIFDNMIQGSEDTAWEYYKRFLPIYSICEGSYKTIQTIKYIMDKIGCCGGASRLPRLELTESDKVKVDSLLSQAGVL